MLKRFLFIGAAVAEAGMAVSLAVYGSYELKTDPIIALSCLLGYYVAVKNIARRRLDE